MKWRTAAAAAGAALMLAAPAGAHHSNVTFYFMDQTIEITGVVRELRLINPHIRLLVEVTGENGETAVWTVDGPNATGLRQRGFTPDMLQPGETVTVIGHPARNPDARGMNGDTVIKSDGTRIDVRSAG